MCSLFFLFLAFVSSSLLSFRALTIVFLVFSEVRQLLLFSGDKNENNAQRGKKQKQKIGSKEHIVD